MSRPRRPRPEPFSPEWLTDLLRPGMHEQWPSSAPALPIPDLLMQLPKTFCNDSDIEERLRELARWCEIANRSPAERNKALLLRILSKLLPGFVIVRAGRRGRRSKNHSIEQEWLDRVRGGYVQRCGTRRQAIKMMAAEKGIPFGTLDSILKRADKAQRARYKRREALALQSLSETHRPPCAVREASSPEIGAEPLEEFGPILGYSFLTSAPGADGS
jgi:hypothetical protein